MKRMLTMALSVLLLLAQGNLFAQDAKKEAKAPAKTYEVDIKESRAYVRVDPNGRGHAHGIVGVLAASNIILGEETKAGELVFDTTSFEADGLAARQYVGLTGTMSAKDRDGINQAMHGPAVLDTRRFPRATYTIASALPLDGQTPGEPGRYRLEGKLNLHGVEQPIRFDVKVEKKAPNTLSMRGQFALLQTNFGIQPYSALLGLVRVRNELQIHGDLILTVPAAEKK